MGLETATYIADLVATNPVGATDAKSEGDNHLRLIKAALQTSFPGMTTTLAAWLAANTGSLGGTLTTAAQPNITSLGTLTSLTASGLITASAGLTVANGQTLTLTGVTVTGGVMSPASVASAGAISGTTGTFSAPVDVTAANGLIQRWNSSLVDDLGRRNWGIYSELGLGQIVLVVSPSRGTDPSSIVMQFGLGAVIVTGTLSASGAISGTTGTFSSHLLPSGYIKLVSADGTSVGLAADRWVGGDGGGAVFINAPTTKSVILGVNNVAITTTTSTGVAVTGTTSSTSFFETTEIAAPAAGAANTARIFAVDSGGGKTILKVQFATGAAQTLATEP